MRASDIPQTRGRAPGEVAALNGTGGCEAQQVAAVATGAQREPAGVVAAALQARQLVRCVQLRAQLRGRCAFSSTPKSGTELELKYAKRVRRGDASAARLTSMVLSSAPGSSETTLLPSRLSLLCTVAATAAGAAPRRTPTPRAAALSVRSMLAARSAEGARGAVARSLSRSRLTRSPQLCTQHNAIQHAALSYATALLRGAGALG